MRFSYLFFSFCLLGTAPALAQTDVPPPVTDTAGDDLMNMLSEGPRKREYVTATFKATRLINGHSVENTGKGVLDFRILHRFGTLNQGVKDFFGLDNAVTKLAFDYGVTDWLTVGIGRSTYEKEFDGYLKARLLRQGVGGGSPLSLSYVGGIYARSADVNNIPDTATYYFSNRVAYANQLLIARKFSDALSLQLMPSHVHYNLVPLSSDPNDVFALGIGGRIKLSRRISFNAEYYYQLNGARLSGTRNALALGFDIETGGHVFQLLFTNSTGMTERTFIGQTTGNWADGDIHFGFNISRVFTVVRPKETRGMRNRIW
jgi:hypothetical protein